MADNLSAQMRAVAERAARIRRELNLPKDTMEQVRAGYVAKREWWNTGGPGVEHKRFAVPFGEEMIPGVRYSPDNASDTTVIYAHGGGWIVGETRSHDRLLRSLSVELNATVLSVEYSLAPEATYPRQINDVVRVLESLDGAGPILLMGDSCGATLMVQVWLALANKEESGCVRERIAGLALFYGAYTRGETQSRIEYSADERGMSREDLEMYERAVLPPGAPADVFELCGRDYRGMPATYLLSAHCDPLRDDSVLLSECLKEVGVPVTYVDVPGVAHEFMQYGKMLDVVDEVITNVAHWNPARHT